MKKNLAKRIVLGLLTGAVLISSSVAWAANYTVYSTGGNGSFGVGYAESNDNDDALNPGGVESAATNSIVIGSNSVISGDSSIGLGFAVSVTKDHSIAIGSEAKATANNSIALGAYAEANGSLSVALGKGSIAAEGDVVSVGDGGAVGGNGPDYRKIVNVENGTSAHDAATVGQMEAITGRGYETINNTPGLTYINQISNKTLTGAVMELDKQVKANADAIANIAAPNLDNYYTKTEADGKFATKEYVDGTFVKIGENNTVNGSIKINEDTAESITIGEEGITVGTNSTHMDSTGFYAGRKNINLDHTYDNVKAAMTEDGKLKAADGKFEVDTEGKVTASSYIIKESNGNETNIKNALDLKANAADVYTKDEADGLLDAKADKTETNTKLAALEQVDQDLKTQIDNIGSGAIAGINQRLEKTNAKINKVGAGAAALAALHPLDYDPEDKLTFSAGMGNYAGENAAALGAFYRPNEKFMVSLGGTMGNGENMVNLGLSIGLDKPNGFAKLSKRELIQKVNLMEAKYEQVEAENEAMKAEMAEMKAMLQALMAKK